MHFTFTNEYPASRVDEIVSYLVGPRLWVPSSDYPDFLDWAERSHRALVQGSKRAVIALTSGDVAGVIIYQRHKQHRDALELKNLTVRPDLHGRHIASFLLRNAEIEGAREFNSRLVVCDAKAKNFAICRFLLSHHYTIAARRDLYTLDSGVDLVYHKPMPCGAT